MAYSSLVALPRAYGTKGIIAGSEKLYIIAYSDLAPLSGSPTGAVYSASTSGYINQIGLASDKKFVEIGLLRSSTGLNQTLTKDLKTNVSFFTQTLTVVLSEMTIENQMFVQSVLNQPVAIILQSRTDKFYFAGGNAKFELATAEGGTGIAETDLQGYTLTFTGTDGTPIQLVDASIVPSLIS